MKKQTFKNYLKIGILLFGMALLFTNCETESISNKEITQTNDLQDATSWFENNPKKNNYSLLNYTEKIDWTLAKVFHHDNKVAVEVPLILKQNFNLVAPKSNASLQSVNRLVFIKNNQSDFSSFIINITALDNNIQLVNDLNKINYFNISEDFSGNILIICNNDKYAVLNLIVIGKEKIKPDNLYSKEPSVSCYEIVELFDVGPPRHTGIIYCVDDSGSNPYNNQPNYPNHGSGGGTSNTTTIDDLIDSINLDPCSKTILEEIINENSIENIINQFADEDSQFTWTLVTNDGSNFENSENHAETNWNNATANSYLTEINSSYSNGATRLSIARTLVHEDIHAYILSYLDSGTSTFTSQFPDLWNELVAKKYGDSNTTSGWNQYHHQEMARNYVTTIASALTIWDNNQNSSQYYTDLAWGGLIETDIFNQTSDLTPEDRIRIADSNIAEDSNNSEAQSNPCN